MKTFAITIIVLAFVYVLIREFWNRRSHFDKPNQPTLSEGERTIEQIMEGKSIDLIYAELDAKELEVLTDNELSVLYGLTKWYEENPPPSNQ